jgi:hypothetical protein
MTTDQLTLSPIPASLIAIVLNVSKKLIKSSYVYETRNRSSLTLTSLELDLGFFA